MTAPYPSPVAVANALRALDATDPGGWAGPIAAACQRHGINSRDRVAAFLANIVHESGRLRSLVENLNYANSVLPGVFGSGRGSKAAAMKLGRPAGSKVPLTRDQQLAIADVVYGGEWGLKNLGNRPGTTDARDFIGRGLIQITGRANYEAFGAVIGVPAAELAAILEDRGGAAESAAAFWAVKDCNARADCGDLSGARRLVNGGFLGLAEVKAYHATAFAALA